MLNKKIYEKYVLKTKENTLATEDLEKLNGDLINIMIEFYVHKNYDEVRKEIKSAKYFISLFNKYIIHSLSYQIGCFSMIIKIFELLMKSSIRKDEFKNVMNALYAKSGVKEILEYIYKNPDSQHKTICEKTSVKNKSYLSQLLKQLENAGCVERYSTGKRSFFSLSVEGQTFIKDKQKSKELEEHILPVEKYNLNYFENGQCNIEPEKKYSRVFFYRKDKNYASGEVNCVGKN